MKHLCLLAVLLLQTVLLYADGREDNLKDKALRILKEKCNTCHIKQNPFRVFNDHNMDRNARRIYDQVFVKNRMPKGNPAALSSEERETLQQWISRNSN